MKLPFVIGNRPIQGNFDALLARMVEAVTGMGVAAAFVFGGGGSSYTLARGYGVASVAGQATGQCRVTLSRAAVDSSALFPMALVSDNAGWATGGVVVNTTTFDIYVTNPTTGGLTNRSFWVICLYVPA